MQWWKDSKFGLFIHFGLYSVLGEGEWAMFNKRMDTSEYGKLKT
ncbi:alpha-L-fucosidase [Chitinophaga filiformis]